MSKADKLLKRVEFYEKMASSEKPENNDLLKRASLFERLALYSDRKSFLEAVAQAAPANDPNRSLINRALQIMQAAGVDEDTTAPLGNAVLFNRVDIPAIQRAIQAATLTKMNQLTHGPQIQELKGISSQLKAPLTPEQQDDAAGGEHITFQGDPKKDRITALPPIDKTLQEAVIRYAIEVGELMPNPEKQKPTGFIGRETRAAIEGIKNYFSKTYPSYDPKKGGTRMTDQQVFQAVKSYKPQPTE